MVWVTREQIWRLIGTYTEDAGLRAQLRRAVGLPRMLARGWTKAFADEFRGFDTGFSTWLRAME